MNRPTTVWSSRDDLRPGQHATLSLFLSKTDTAAEDRVLHVLDRLDEFATLLFRGVPVHVRTTVVGSADVGVPRLEVEVTKEGMELMNKAALLTESALARACVSEVETSALVLSHRLDTPLRVDTQIYGADDQRIIVNGRYDRRF